MALSTVIVSTRTTDPDLATLLPNLRTPDPSVNIVVVPGNFTYTLTKSTDWTSDQINSATSTINAALSSEQIAQINVDTMPIFQKAFLLTLLDQINVLRTKVGLATVTPAQAIQAVRDKAGTL